MKEEDDKTDLSAQITLLVEINVLSVLTVHSEGNFGVVSFVILFELQFGHAVEQLRQMSGNLQKYGLTNCLYWCIVCVVIKIFTIIFNIFLTTKQYIK